ncbi:MAG: CvpA family protein [Lactobacillaceae bacterium]|nr:CvpA family protein [Lactobacillaceae bacterium]
MIISIIIIAALVLAAVKGHRYGLARTLALSAGRILVWALAVLLAHNVGNAIHQLFTGVVNAKWATPVATELADKAPDFLFSGLGFAIISIVGMIIVSLVQRGLKFINKIPLLGGLNRLLGMALNILVIYIGIFFVLQVVGTWNLPWFHDQITNSPVAQFVMTKTPLLSDKIYQWFLLV